MADEDITQISASDMQAAVAKHTGANPPKAKKAATPKASSVVAASAPVVSKPGAKSASEVAPQPSTEAALLARVAALEVQLTDALNLVTAGASDAEDLEGRRSVQNQGQFGVPIETRDLGNGTTLVNF